MLGYFSMDIICSQKGKVFGGVALRKTLSFKEQRMSEDKYPCNFLRQMQAFVSIILQIFFATRAVLEIWEYLVNKPLQAAGMSADNVRG